MKYYALLKNMQVVVFFFVQAEDGIRDLVRSRGLGDVYKRQGVGREDGHGHSQGTGDVRPVRVGHFGQPAHLQVIPPFVGRLLDVGMAGEVDHGHPIVARARLARFRHEAFLQLDLIHI